MHNQPGVQCLSCMRSVRVKTAGWGFLEVSVGILRCRFKSALDPPLNGITSSVSLLNAKSLSQQQIFGVWGAVELHFRPMDLSMFHPPFPFFCLVVSLQLLMCLYTSWRGVLQSHAIFRSPSTRNQFNVLTSPNEVFRLTCASRSDCLVRRLEGLPVHSQGRVS